MEPRGRKVWRIFLTIRSFYQILRQILGKEDFRFFADFTGWWFRDETPAASEQ
jgi:hypothetical protein